MKGREASRCGLGLELHHLSENSWPSWAQAFGVDLDALKLHLRQHAGHGTFEGLVHADQLVAGEAGFQMPPYPQGHVGVFGGVGGGGGQFDLGEADLLLPLSPPPA